MHVFFFPAEGD